jgi:hypothetical protein
LAAGGDLLTKKLKSVKRGAGPKPADRFTLYSLKGLYRFSLGSELNVH